jgi:hypothetical protein
MGENGPGKGWYGCGGRSAPKGTVPKCPSAKKKFRTKVVVMIEDCCQVMVRLRREKKNRQPTLAGIIEKELIEFRSERGPGWGAYVGVQLNPQQGIHCYVPSQIVPPSANVPLPE